MEITAKVLLSIAAILFFGLITRACAAQQPVQDVSQEALPAKEEIVEEDPTIEPADETLPLDEKQDWDLVLIGDSTGGSVIYLLADTIEQETGKAVTFHNYSISGLPAVRVLKALRGETEGLIPEILKNLQGDIAKAEMVVFFANPEEIPELDALEDSMGICLNFRLCQAPTQCEAEYFLPYVEVLDQIYQEIFTLRDGVETIVRAYNFYNPLISGNQDCGTDGACTKCWENFNAAVQTAAKKNGVPVADVYALFNGPAHDENPLDKGFIGSNKIHPTEDGFKAIAELIHELGYQPVLP